MAVGLGGGGAASCSVYFFSFLASDSKANTNENDSYPLNCINNANPHQGGGDRCPGNQDNSSLFVTIVVTILIERLRVCMCTLYVLLSCVNELYMYMYVCNSLIVTIIVTVL